VSSVKKKSYGLFTCKKLSLAAPGSWLVRAYWFRPEVRCFYFMVLHDLRFKHNNKKVKRVFFLGGGGGCWAVGELRLALKISVR
jgi:hypothetical protein